MPNNDKIEKFYSKKCPNPLQYDSSYEASGIYTSDEVSMLVLA